jgi:hypothetical protein
VDGLIRAALSVWRKHFTVEPLAIGAESGIVWVTAPGRTGGVNGYALIPAEGHPWSAGFHGADSDDFDPDDLHLCAPRGITCCDHPWLGFDTAHYGDCWPRGPYNPEGLLEYSHRQPWFVDWTPELVAEEAMRLARQVFEIGYVARQLHEGLMD